MSSLRNVTFVLIKNPQGNLHLSRSKLKIVLYLTKGIEVYDFCNIQTNNTDLDVDNSSLTRAILAFQ